MPVYLFTFHAYASWMPDRKQGYVQKGKGILPTDPHLAQRYRDRQTQDKIQFGKQHQQTLIDAAQGATAHLQARLHGIATDPTHIHILISWDGNRKTIVIRTALKQALTRGLNATYEKRKWFSRQGSQKRVTQRQHFDQLIQTYLHKHSGLSWYES